MSERTRLLTLRLVLCALVAIALAPLFISLFGDEPGVTERNGRRIREGMTWDEVKRIFGWAPGDTDMSDAPEAKSPATVYWLRANALAVIDFVQDESKSWRVVKVVRIEERNPIANFFRRLRARL